MSVTMESYKMNKLDVKLYNPDPFYLRSLIKKAGLTQDQAAERIGIGNRTMRSYLADVSVKTARQANYSIQFALENL